MQRCNKAMSFTHRLLGGNKEVGTASFNYTVVQQTSGKCRPGCQTVIVVWIQVGRDGATVCSYRLSAFSLRRANTESLDLLLFLFTRGIAQFTRRQGRCLLINRNERKRRHKPSANASVGMQRFCHATHLRILFTFAKII